MWLVIVVVLVLSVAMQSINGFITTKQRIGCLVNTEKLITNRIVSNNLLLFAKKKGKKMEAKGFSTKVRSPIENNDTSIDTNTVDSTNKVVPPTNVKINSESPTSADEVFKKWGIAEKDITATPKQKKPVSSSSNEDRPFGESVIAGIPANLQKNIDNILVTSTFLSLSFVVLSGIGKILPIASAAWLSNHSYLIVF